MLCFVRMIRLIHEGGGRQPSMGATDLRHVSREFKRRPARERKKNDKDRQNSRNRQL